MKLTATFAALFAMSTVMVSASTFEDGIKSFEGRSFCSGQRQAQDKCTGRRLGAQNSFHNWYEI